MPETLPEFVYVLGFMFDEGKSRVALMRKLKPEWQRGRLNGIGGKVEPGEEPKAAMVREFREETGVATEPEKWQQFCGIEGGDWKMHCFAATGDLSALQPMEAEPVEVVELIEVFPGRADALTNLPWLIAMAVERLNSGEPCFAWVQYR